MSVFTRLGALIWEWEPWLLLENEVSRLFWLALYTSPAAKRMVPGLWHGGLPVMAEAAHMSVEKVRRSLDDLFEDHGAGTMAEYDDKSRVLRLTQLPDSGESPANGKTILGWWRRFQSVPECQVRDAHVTTLSWILSDWMRVNSKTTLSENHREAWASTFGTVTIPAPRRRGVRRLSDNCDTSTPVQPSLFPSRDTVSDPSEASPITPPVDNSDSLRNLNKITGPETVSDTVSKQTGSGHGSGYGSSSLLSGDPEPPPASSTIRLPDGRAVTLGDWQQRGPEDPPEEPARPRLQLLAGGLPFAAGELVRVLAPNVRWSPDDVLLAALSGSIAVVSKDHDRGSFLVLKDWLASGARLDPEIGEWLADPTTVAFQTDPNRRVKWALRSDLLALALSRARDAKATAEARSADLAEARNKLGI